MKYSDSFKTNSSKILLGTAYFGDNISTELSFEIMDAYYELGGRHIDTARLYADGESERIVGEWYRDRKPEGLTISTKGAFPHAETPNVSRLSEEEIRYDLEASLKALKFDNVHFYWLHRDDETIPASQIIETMNKLVREGKIKHFGASNWRYTRIDEANKYARSRGIQGFEGSQIRFGPAVISPDGNADMTLVDIDSESFDYYATNKLPVAAYASQSKGFFSKLAEKGIDALSQKAKGRYLCDENLRRLEILKQLSKKYEVSIAALICSSLSSIQSPDVFPIIGGSNCQQIKDSMSASDLVIDKQELRELFKFNI